MNECASDGLLLFILAAATFLLWRSCKKDEAAKGKDPARSYRGVNPKQIAAAGWKALQKRIAKRAEDQHLAETGETIDGASFAGLMDRYGIMYDFHWTTRQYSLALMEICENNAGHPPTPQALLAAAIKAVPNKHLELLGAMNARTKESKERTRADIRARLFTECLEPDPDFLEN